LFCPLSGACLFSCQSFGGLHQYRPQFCLFLNDTPKLQIRHRRTQVLIVILLCNAVMELSLPQNDRFELWYLAVIDVSLVIKKERYELLRNVHRLRESAAMQRSNASDRRRMSCRPSDGCRRAATTGSTA
jgi:hypothetical protein